MHAKRRSQDYASLLNGCRKHKHQVTAADINAT